MSSSRWTASRWVEYGCKEEAYEWTQTPEEVTLTLQVPAGTRAKDIEVVFRPTHLRVALRGASDALVEGDLTRTIVVDESTWTKSDNTVEIVLAKGAESRGDEEQHWWASVIRGHREADVKAMASTRFLDESLLKRIWEDKHAAAAAEAAPQATEAAPTTEAQ